MTALSRWPVTDSQVHLFPPSSQTVARQFGHRVMGADDLIAKMDRAGVSRAVLIPPRVADATNDDALTVTARWPKRLAVVGKVARYRQSWGPLIQRWRDLPMLGLRVSFP